MLSAFLLSLGLTVNGLSPASPHVVPPVSSAPRSASVTETVVFRNGEGGYTCYRIPAIVRTPEGELLAFAEGRVTDCGDYGDVDIVMRSSKDGGKTWSAISRVADVGALQVGNPAPVYDRSDRQFPKGRLFLLYNTGSASESDVRKGKAVREVWYITSTDAGKTWSEPVNITKQVSRPNQPATNPAYSFSEDWRSYANTPGHALQLQKGPHKGRIFVAANHSAGSPQPHFQDYRAHGFYSDDHGKSWQLSPTIPYPGGNESTAAETSEGGILMNIRNQSGDVKNRLLARSSNAGISWEPVEVAQDLPDPVCQGSMIDYPLGGGQSALLFSNPNSQTKRERLTVRVSKDGGQHWSAGKEVYNGSAAYSDLVVPSAGQVGVLYEKDNYTQIVYASFPYQDLN
ncbi:sialidase family protein [Spirosoma pomorum]